MNDPSAPTRAGGSPHRSGDTGAPRVRFAPSPTGYLHVGSARTALFNWLFARSTGGTMILRIEDTDTERNRDELIDDLLAELRWLGIDWDEGPVLQSARRDRHAEAVRQLLASGAAYLCDADNRPVEGSELTEGLAVRFRVPDDVEITVDDIIRGPVTFRGADLEDFVVWRSNGTPTFLLANAVDDADAAITHAIRGEDLLPGTPKVMLIARALGLPSPRYAHLPLLVNAQRKKLSKRRDDVSVAEFRARGFLPEAMVNLLALCGWGPPDGVERRPVAEIIELFRLEDVTRAPAYFDVDKLRAFNAAYIRELDVDRFVELARPHLPAGVDEGSFRRLAPLVQERVETLAEVGPMVGFLAGEDVPIDESAWERKVAKDPELSRRVLEAFVAAAEDPVFPWDAEHLGERFRALADHELGVKRRLVDGPVRVAVTGAAVGPPLFESLEVLGRERSLRRLRAALDRLGASATA